jgi:hypothetical protein
VRTADVKTTNRFKYIRISNQERTSGTPSNFTVALGNDPMLDRCTEIQVMTCSIPNVEYNVSEAIGNNTFTITFLPGNVVRTFTVFDGLWTTAQLIAKINTLLPPAGTFTAAQDPNSGVIFFISTVSPFVISGSPTFPNTTSMNSYLGFTQDSDPAGVLQYDADTKPSLFGSTMMYVHSPEMASNVTYLDTLTTGGRINDVNGFISIPVTVPYNSVQNYIGQPEDRIVFGRRGRSVRNFSIVLRTNNGREMLDLGDNDQVVIVLKAFFSVDQH